MIGVFMDQVNLNTDTLRVDSPRVERVGRSLSNGSIVQNCTFWDGLALALWLTPRKGQLAGSGRCLLLTQPL